MSYYRKFGAVLHNPLFRFYIRWVYKRCLRDLGKLGAVPNFKKKSFTCLLCGVGHEATADEFISFVSARNPMAKIIIIDLGKEQINAVNKLVKHKYPALSIVIKQINALNLDRFIQTESVDWIETDGLLEYFDKKSLAKLLKVWHKILTPDGFITTRDFASVGRFERVIDNFRIWLGKVWLGVVLHSHSWEELEKLFQAAGFRYTTHEFLFPTFYRFSLIKR